VMSADTLPLPFPEFQAWPQCRDCPLYQNATHPGLPARPCDDLLEREGGRRPDGTPVLLVVGQNPGYQEDRQGRSWVGKSGQFLHAALRQAGIHAYADVYLTNAVRCVLDKDQDLTRTPIKACSPRISRDVQAIRAVYPTSPLVILYMGAPAASTVGYGTLTAAFSMGQGRPHPIPGDPDQQAISFFADHPARILRDPSRVLVLAEHLGQVARFLQNPDKDPMPAVPPPLPPPYPPTPFPTLFALDIETYGILKGWKQTAFHPVKSARLDAVPFGSQIIVVGVAWKDADDEGGNEHTGVFVFGDRRDRAMLHRWIAEAVRHGSVILGKNLPFDVLYLRANDPVCRKWLRPGIARLDDVDVWNHLDFEARPERSLKPLAELLGVGSYAALTVNARHPEARAKSAHDPALHRYVTTDAAYTLRLRHLLEERIRQRYGPDSPKLSSICADFRNTLLWNVIEMAEAGFRMDTTRLRQHHDRLIARAEEVAAQVADTLTLSGKGSETSRRQCIERAITEADAWDDDRIELTEKTGKVSTGKNNVNLLISILERDKPNSRSLLELRAMREWASHMHLVTSYTRPLLEKPTVGLLMPEGMAYPTWYPVPGKWSGDYRDAAEGDRLGGTIQGRITARRPAPQTFPPFVKDCIISRWGRSHQRRPHSPGALPPWRRPARRPGPCHVPPHPARPPGLPAHLPAGRQTRQLREPLPGRRSHAPHSHREGHRARHRRLPRLPPVPLPGPHRPAPPAPGHLLRLLPGATGACQTAGLPRSPYRLEPHLRRGRLRRGGRQLPHSVPGRPVTPFRPIRPAAGPASPQHEKPHRPEHLRRPLRGRPAR